MIDLRFYGKINSNIQLSILTYWRIGNNSS